MAVIIAIFLARVVVSKNMRPWEPRHRVSPPISSSEEDRHLFDCLADRDALQSAAQADAAEPEQAWRLFREALAARDGWL